MHCQSLAYAQLHYSAAVEECKQHNDAEQEALICLWKLREAVQVQCAVVHRHKLLQHECTFPTAQLYTQHAEHQMMSCFIVLLVRTPSNRIRVVVTKFAKVGLRSEETLAVILFTNKAFSPRSSASTVIFRLACGVFSIHRCLVKMRCLHKAEFDQGYRDDTSPVATRRVNSEAP